MLTAYSNLTAQSDFWGWFFFMSIASCRDFTELDEICGWKVSILECKLLKRKKLDVLANFSKKPKALKGWKEIKSLLWTITLFL